MNPVRLAPRLAILAFSLALAASAVEAKEPDPVQVGDRVRVTVLAGSPPMTGRLLELDRETLGLRLDAADDSGVAARRIPRATVATLELDRSHGNAGTGALIGLAVGLTIGLILAGNHETLGDSDYYALSAVGGGLVYGTLGGAIIGSQIREERWEPRPLPPASAGDQR